MEIDKMNAAAASDKSGVVHVVDDMEDVLFVVGMLVTTLGYRALTARSATEGLRILGREPVDVVITDVNMPECDGLAFLKEVRHLTQDVPVVLMTGGAHLDMAMEAIRNGAFDLITKPLEPKHLHTIVEKALRHRRLLTMERNYHSELERTVSQQTAQLREVLLELDRFHNLEQSRAEERSQFLSTLTHELRTPMNGIICPLSMLSSSELPDDDRELVEIAQVSAGNMLQLVDQLLSFADHDKRWSLASYETIDLRTLLAASTRASAALSESRGLAMTVSVDDAVPATVTGDRELTGKIIDILLGNAVKFTDAGSISLRVGIGTDHREMPVLRLQVRDTGIGIPAQLLERVFEPFFQVDGSLTRRHGGLGLGLSQARQIVQHLGGRIWVESDPGQGSTFQVELPCFGVAAV